MNNFLTLNYWFNLRPESLIPLAQRIFVVFIVLLAVLSFLIAFLKRRGGIYRGFLKRLYGFCLVNAVIGLALLFFNYETIPFLSARFWLLLWMIAMIVWLVYIIKGLRTIPAKRRQQEEENDLKKYLP